MNILVQSWGQLHNCTTNRKRIVTCAQDGSLQVWKLQTGEQIVNWTDGESGIWAIALSVDKKTVSGSSDGVVRSRKERFRSGRLLWVTLCSSTNSSLWRRINVVRMCNESSVLVARRID